MRKVVLSYLFLSKSCYTRSFIGMVSTRRSLLTAATAAAASSKRAINNNKEGDSFASSPTSDDPHPVETPNPVVVKRVKKANLKILPPPRPPPPRSTNGETASNAAAGAGGKLLLFSLQDDNHNEPLVAAKLVCRPSQRNRSPYVADIELLNDKNRIALCHVPSLDLGGKCVPGSRLLVRPARDKNGRKVLATAVSPKYGTPKCEYIAQLLYVDESVYETERTTTTTGNNNSTNAAAAAAATTPTTMGLLYPPTWIGAHPNLGERIAEIWLRQNLIPGIPPALQVETQVRNPSGTTDMRCDFLLTLAPDSNNGRQNKCLVEVKTVVDTDYSALAPPPPASLQCRFITTPTPTSSTTRPYTRTAIFPWGKSKQKGPDGEKVVSARAIKHVRTLTQIVQKELPVVITNDSADAAAAAAADADADNVNYTAVILFVVIRGDAQAFRPNYDACPSFGHYLKQARNAGVQVLAKRVSWDEYGNCYHDNNGMLPIEWR
jgi:DNA-binding sugar fermentation-stimulating protein